MSCGAIRYTLNIIGYLEAYGMSVRIVSCIALVAAVSLSGCGFKSDLFLPEDEEEGNLISELFRQMRLKIATACWRKPQQLPLTALSSYRPVRRVTRVYLLI